MRELYILHRYMNDDGGAVVGAAATADNLNSTHARLDF